MRLPMFLAVTLAAVAAPAAADAPSRMSPEAKAYLDDAIQAFKDRHINREKVDWAALTARAYAIAGNAQRPADTYKAIQSVVDGMGEKHTFFMKAEQVKAIASGSKAGKTAPPPFVTPDGSLLPGRVGLIRLPAFMGSREQGRAYTAVAKAMLDRFAAQRSCGTIVDLRGNGGGNMWPMLNGVKALLGSAPFGSFYGGDRSEETSVWVEKDGEIQPVPGKLVPTAGADKRLKPVAVLIGPKTASSGEFTAMAFRGRAQTRFFGAPTAGYVSANELIGLKDGAQIAMTSGWGTDRNGTAYTDRMVPDQATVEGLPTMDAALAWLKKRGCGR